MKNKLYVHRLPIIFVVATIIFFTTIWWFHGKLQENLSMFSYSSLVEVMEQQANNFEYRIDSQFEMIKTIADVGTYLVDEDMEIMLKLLNDSVEKREVGHLGIADVNGQGLTEGRIHDVGTYEFFYQALNGETVLSQPYWSDAFEGMVLSFATPIYQNQEVVNVMYMTYTEEELNDLFNVPFFEGNGYTFIVGENGEIIAETPDQQLFASKNIYDVFRNSRFSADDDFGQIRRNMAAGTAGVSKYEYNEQTFLTSYKPLPLNNWYAFSMVSPDILGVQAMEIAKETGFFELVVALIIIGLMLYIVRAQKQYIKNFSDLAFIDSLTGVANRRKFQLNAEEILISSKQKYAFVILDIDKFKVLNDTLGYDNGDRLLINMAEVLQTNMQIDETFGRCDSDEFFLLLAYTDEPTLRLRIELIIVQIENAFKENIDINYNLVLCAGIYVILDREESMNGITDRAKHAHELVKGGQRSMVSFYDETIRNRILEEKNIENLMQNALLNNEFALYLQPKYYLSDESIYGAEALVRWDTGQTDLIYPDSFIPVFEKNGFITRLDMYMLEKVCLSIRQWMDNGVTPVPVSINFSRLHLKNGDFVDNIAAVINKHNIPPELIEVELTESTMLHNEAVLIDVLNHLHEHGLRLSMDDFGSGYSSLGLLKNLPVDVIKLDRTFFTQYNDLERAKTVISSVISMAKKLGIRTVAEGVETKEHIDFLRNLGCDIVQGYYYARPMAALRLDEFLAHTESGQVAEESKANNTI